ncbi:MAG: hypothetical protein PVH10_06980, partial [Methyloceanibacter sp.]
GDTYAVALSRAMARHDYIRLSDGLRPGWRSEAINRIRPISAIGAEQTSMRKPKMSAFGCKAVVAELRSKVG